MDKTRACILLTHAMGQADLEASVQRSSLNSFGVFVVASGHEAMSVIRTVVETLDHRIEVMDADRTNLNDLEVWDSPMRQMARFAHESDKTYVFLLRGWVKAMGEDPRMVNFRECYGGSNVPMILSDTAEGIPDNFVLCNLSSL